ncbi:aTPases with chaperone activity ATP-binding subunit [Clostridium sp. CAG:762]|nr:aTPases with chaperone activity ATP-binding subunit [Clostridium sp. CAG:762]
MFGNFSEEAQNILVKAKLEMLELKHPYIGTEHLVLSMLSNSKKIKEKLSSYHLDYEIFKKEIIKVLGIGEENNSLFLYTPLLKKVINSAILDSKDNNDGVVTTEHLFSSLLEAGEGVAIRIFLSMGIDINAMYVEFATSLVKKVKPKKNRKLLIEELGINLNEKAKNNLTDPVIDRDKEIERVLEILCRRTKNNPILIGNAGVGKTAIVEELAKRIVTNEVPDYLKNKKIISLDMATTVAGTKYRGEFEERMKKILNEIETNDDIILFIDEIHTLVGAGGAEGAIDASNILKPALARGHLRCIGATTVEEYKKFIEKDKALERRFQKVNIEEPSYEKTLEILTKLKPIYEKFHKVILQPELLEDIVKLSAKYIYDRSEPDKSIDIMDEVCSRVSIKETKIDKEITSLELEIDKLDKLKNSYIIENNIDKAYTYRKKEIVLQEKLNNLMLNINRNNKIVTIKDVANVIHTKTQIPVYEILKDDAKVVKNIEKQLRDNIVGQDEAIKNLIDITKRIKFGYKSDNKCISFLFVGPSGTGKTALSKIYANLLVGGKNLIRLDMSEYADVTSVNKIVGSAPGYVGYDDNKNILDEIRNKPYSVILLDEIEKAHPQVINLFYQILDDGLIKDSKGNTIKFNNNIIIMTSNIGYEKNNVGFNNKAESTVLNELKNELSLPFVNRIDNIILFNHLTEENIRNIIKNKINVLKKKYANVTIKIGKNAVNEIVELSNYYDFGARKVDKIIKSRLENVIIDSILDNKSTVFITSLKKKQSI